MYGKEGCFLYISIIFRNKSSFCIYTCTYTNRFALIRESYAFIRESFTLIRESYAFIRESFALIRECFAFIREKYNFSSTKMSSIGFRKNTEKIQRQ